MENETTNTATAFLSEAEIEKKAAELSKTAGVEVVPMVFVTENNEQIVGYLKTPSRVVKMRIMDTSIKSPMFAAAELLEACLIAEESDARILAEDPQYDSINLGACLAASGLLKMVADTYKKK